MFEWLDRNRIGRYAVRADRIVSDETAFIDKFDNVGEAVDLANKAYEVYKLQQAECNHVERFWIVRVLNWDTQEYIYNCGVM
jgi:hypothetical protein